MINLFKVFMSEAAVFRSSKVLRSGKLTQGPEVDAFESELATHFDNPNIVTLNSCTSAIHLALDLIKDEVGPCTVLTTPMTCAATNLPILHNGLKIKWYDLPSKYFYLQPSCYDWCDIVSKFDATTRILILVHWGGIPTPHEKIMELKKIYENRFGKTLYVIEDCAHAWGSMNDGRRVGSFGDFAAFSCQAIKTLTTGDGGVLITPDTFYRRARLKRWFGLDRDNKLDFRSCQDINLAGYKFHMNDVAASIGRGNLPHVDRLVNLQRGNANFYNEKLAPKYQIKPTNCTEPSYWLYTIQVSNRDKFTKYMTEHGIEVNPVHSRNDKYHVFKDYAATLPNLDEIAPRMVCIPCGWWLTSEERDFVAEKVNEYVDVY